MQAIIIYGNIASGKSTTSEFFRKNLPDFTYVCIDEFRAVAAKNDRHKSNFEREKWSERECLNLINQSRYIIFESILMNQLWKEVEYSLVRRDFKIHYVSVICPPQFCVRRFYERRLEKGINFILPFSSSVEEIIKKWHYNFRVGNKPDIVINGMDELETISDKVDSYTLVVKSLLK